MRQTAQQNAGKEPLVPPLLEVHAAESDNEGERPGACGLHDAASSRGACGCCRCEKQAEFAADIRQQPWYKTALVSILRASLRAAPSPPALSPSCPGPCANFCTSCEQSWWLPRRVVPVEHARDCLCSLVDASHNFARRAGPGAAGAGLLGLAVGSFCCAAAATKMRASHEWPPQLLRLALAIVALCGFSTFFARLFSKHAHELWAGLPQHPFRIVLAYIAATAISSAAVTVAAVIAVATAARVYFRAAVDYGTRNEPQRWMGLAVDLLERGALLLQMLLMTQWVFGEFSVMPVMSTMGMMFALLHNYGETADRLLWWDEAF